METPIAYSMPSHKETQHSINEIHKEKNQLERNNDVLAEKIATTHALQNYYQRLKEHNRALKLSNVQKNPSQIDVDYLYDQEVERLRQELKACHEKERVLDREYQDAEHDLKQAKVQLVASEKHVGELRHINDQARREADKAAQELTALHQECEEYKKILEFQTEVHDAEIANLRAIANQPSNNYNPKYEAYDAHEIDIQSVLDDFRKEYQDILEKAYEQERRDLIEECVKLERRIQELEQHLTQQKGKIVLTTKEIQNLRQELEELEARAKAAKLQGVHDQRKFEEERDQLLAKIVQLEAEKVKLERELQRLIDEDNVAVKLIIQLQLEINAYRALMEAEEGKYDGRDIDPNGLLEIPLHVLPATRRDSTSDSEISHV